jgi:hypothetical protein
VPRAVKLHVAVYYVGHCRSGANTMLHSVPQRPLSVCWSQTYQPFGPDGCMTTCDSCMTTVIVTIVSKWVLAFHVKAVDKC